MITNFTAEIDGFTRVAEHAPQALQPRPRGTRRRRTSQPDPASRPSRKAATDHRHHLIGSRGQMKSTPDRTAAPRAARAKDSQDKRRRVLAAVQALEASGAGRTRRPSHRARPNPSPTRCTRQAPRPTPPTAGRRDRGTRAVRAHHTRRQPRSRWPPAHRRTRRPDRRNQPSPTTCPRTRRRPRRRQGQPPASYQKPKSMTLVHSAHQAIRAWLRMAMFTVHPR